MDPLLNNQNQNQPYQYQQQPPPPYQQIPPPPYQQIPPPPYQQIPPPPYQQPPPPFQGYDQPPLPPFQGYQQPPPPIQGYQQQYSQPNQVVPAYQGNAPLSTGAFACLSTLASLQGVYIKQKFEALEALTGCETKNVYKVFIANNQGDMINENPIFRCKEKSECLQRICCPGDCRSFDMDIRQYINGNTSDTVMYLQRPFFCTCCCLNRPHLDVYIQSVGHQEYIGRITCPFKCCDKEVQIYGRDGQLRYRMVADCCQLGFFCPMPCNACQIIVFQVQDQSGQHVTNMTKVSAGCCKSCVSDSDNFKVPFPPGASQEDKALFVAATLFIDYRYFEENPQENRQR